MSQTTLTEHAPVILDSTCSFSKIWPRFASIRMDIRKITKPDIVADARFLPFRDKTLDQIYCDPPHMIRKDTFILAHDAPFLARLRVRRKLTGRTSLDEFSRYGTFPSKLAWLDFLTKTDEEFARTLKTGGALFYKLTDGKDKRLIQRQDLDSMHSFRIVSEKITKSRVNKSNNVHWLRATVSK